MALTRRRCHLVTFHPGLFWLRCCPWLLVVIRPRVLITSVDMHDTKATPSTGSKMNQIRILVETRSLTIVVELPTPQPTPTSSNFPVQSINPSLLSPPEGYPITRIRQARSRSRKRPTRAVSTPVTTTEFATVIKSAPRPPKAVYQRLQHLTVTLPPPPLCEYI